MKEKEKKQNSDYLMTPVKSSRPKKSFPFPPATGEEEKENVPPGKMEEEKENEPLADEQQSIAVASCCPLADGNTTKEEHQREETQEQEQEQEQKQEQEQE